MTIKEQLARLSLTASALLTTVKNQANDWQYTVEEQIKRMEDWKNRNDVEKICKFTLDLSELDANTMYPVWWRYGSGVHEQSSWAEVNISRQYSWNAKAISPFSDNKSSTHIAGLSFIAKGCDYPWSGAGWHSHIIEMYRITYMHTIQNASFGMKMHKQKYDSTIFEEVEGLPLSSSSIYSGMYLRGGLLYKGTCKGMKMNPKFSSVPVNFYNNTPYNYSEWVVPYAYSSANNMAEVINK